MQWNLLLKSLTLIHKSYKGGHNGLIFEHKVEHDNRCLNVSFGEDSCNDITIVNIKSFVYPIAYNGKIQL